MLWPSHLPKAYLLVLSHWKLRFQHINIGMGGTQNSDYNTSQNQICPAVAPQNFVEPKELTVCYHKYLSICGWYLCRVWTSQVQGSCHIFFLSWACGIQLCVSWLPCKVLGRWFLEKETASTFHDSILLPSHPMIQGCTFPSVTHFNGFFRLITSLVRSSHISHFTYQVKVKLFIYWEGAQCHGK